MTIYYDSWVTHPGFMYQGASTIFHQMSVKEASVYGGTEGTSMSGSGPQGDTQGDEDDGICIYIYICISLEPVFSSSLLGLKPPSGFLFQSKQGLYLGFRYIYIYT